MEDLYGELYYWLIKSFCDTASDLIYYIAYLLSYYLLNNLICYFVLDLSGDFFVGYSWIVVNWPGLFWKVGCSFIIMFYFLCVGELYVF